MRTSPDETAPIQAVDCDPSGVAGARQHNLGREVRDEGLGPYVRLAGLHETLTPTAESETPAPTAGSHRGAVPSVLLDRWLSKHRVEHAVAAISICSGCSCGARNAIANLQPGSLGVDSFYLECLTHACCWSRGRGTWTRSSRPKRPRMLAKRPRSRVDSLRPHRDLCDAPYPMWPDGTVRHSTDLRRGC